MQNCFIFLMLSLLAGRQIASAHTINNNVIAQHYTDTTVRLNWLTLDEVTAQMSKQKKPVLIDLYTDWCGWCKELYASVDVDTRAPGTTAVPHLQRSQPTVCDWFG